MKKVIAIFFATLACLTQAEGQFSTNDKATSSLNFQIVIPKMTATTRHTHPIVISVGDNKEELTITHNLTKICLKIEVANQDPGWNMEILSTNWEVIRHTNNYHLCTLNRGQVNLEMTHTFTYISQPWPVRFTISPY